MCFACVYENRYCNMWVQDAEYVSEIYRLSILQALHNIHLGTSKMVKEALIAYLSSDIILTNLGDTPNKRKPLMQGRESLLCGFNAYSSAFEKKTRSTGMKIGFLQLIPASSLMDYLQLMVQKQCWIQETIAH